MKNEILIFVGILAALVFIAGASVYFAYTSRSDQPETLPSETGEIPQEPSSDEVTTVELGQDSEQEAEANEPDILIRDGFSINIPPGWAEAVTSSDSLALVLDLEEEITDEKAQEIGFVTYYSVNNNYLGEFTFEEYVEKLKDSLELSISTIEYLHQWDGQIGSNPAIFLEIQSYQQEIDFRTSVVFIDSADGIVWAISFNTLKDAWPRYQDLFYQTAESFRLD